MNPMRVVLCAAIGLLSMPVFAQNAGPPIFYAPSPPGPVAFGNVTISANAVSNIVATPSGGAGGGTTTLGACVIAGADAAQFALVSAATLTFTAGTTTPQTLGVRFTPALPVGAKVAGLACTETVQGGATTIRLWNLTGFSVQPTAVPTLGGFGLWAMLGLMLGTGLVIVSTRKQ